MKTNPSLAGKMILALAIILAFAFPPSVHPAVAFGWNEVGDAGNVSATAQNITGTGSLAFIVGTISGANDFDVFRFSITDPSQFSVFPNANGNLMLSLFDASGRGIAFNDDFPGAGLHNPMLPSGNPLYANLSPGLYLLGISQYTNLPITSALAQIFNDAIPTAVTGPVNSGVFAAQTNVSGTSSPLSSIPYGMKINGAGPVPEPGTWVMGVALLAAAAAPLLRRKCSH